MAFTPNIAGATHATPGDATALTGMYPSNVGGLGSNILTQKYIGTLYDFTPWAIERDVRERHGRFNYDFLFLLGMFGMKRGKAAPTFGHYERDWHYNAIKIGAEITASAGAGTTAIYGLHADAMYNGSQTASGVAVKSSDIKVGDILQFYDGTLGQVTLKNTSVDPHRISIAPLDSTEEIPALASGDLYAIVTNAFAEGTDLPKSRFPRLTKYTNTFQIVKASAGSTGSSLTNETFVQFKPAGDGSIMAVVSDMMREDFERNRSGAVLFGAPINNITTFVSALEIDVPVTGTEGMLRWATTYGHTQSYTPGSYSLDDFYAIGRTMREEQCQDRTFMTLDGYDIFIETEQLFSDQFANGANTPMMLKNIANINGGLSGIPDEDFQPFLDTDFDFYVGFRAAHIGGYTFAFKQLHEFSDVQGVGASGYDYSKWRVVVPLGRRTDGVTGGDTFAWGYEYKQLGGYSREAVYGNIAGVGVAGAYTPAPASHAFDYAQEGLVSELGFHGACPNQSYIQKPAA